MLPGAWMSLKGMRAAVEVKRQDLGKEFRFAYF